MVATISTEHTGSDTLKINEEKLKQKDAVTYSLQQLNILCV